MSQDLAVIRGVVDAFQRGAPSEDLSAVRAALERDDVLGAKLALTAWAQQQPNDAHRMSVRRKTQCLRMMALSSPFSFRRKVI